MYIYGIQEVLILILTHVCFAHLRVGSVLKGGTGGVGGWGHLQGAVGTVATCTRRGHGSY